MGDVRFLDPLKVLKTIFCYSGYRPRLSQSAPLLAFMTAQQLSCTGYK